MKIPILKFLLSGVIVGGLSGCATAPSSSAESTVEDQGYFLSWEQKGQLIGSGRIKDTKGTWYDVWVVPGYAEPAQETMTYLGKAGSDFGEYFGSKKYNDLGDASWDALTWGFDDCLYDFTIKGLPEAWDGYWSTAEKRTSKRVFGWWFAYPWALLESIVDPVVRIPFGLGGTALGTVAGVAIVPSYYAVNSTVKGTWHLTVDALLLPTIACSWNTIIAPPMSLVGQKPAPSRVDGFWVKQLNEEDLLPTQIADPISEKDVEALAVWGRLLLKTIPPFDKQRQDVEQKATEAKKEIHQKMTEALEALRADPAQKETLDYLRSRNFNTKRTSKAFEDLRLYLKNKLSEEELDQLIRLLQRYAPSATPKQTPLRPKTDPVKHSFEVIQEME